MTSSVVSAIKEIVERRGIKALLHFTQVENVDGIVTHGLLPRDQYESCNVSPLLTDEMRLDNCLGAVSLSIGFPNYKMFYRCRMEKANTRWAVIGLHSSILWEKDCAFCIENAAKNTVVSIPIADRKGALAFEKMFEEIADKPNRKTMLLKDGFPTNPQAEVLVFDRIEPTYILGVGFKEQELADEYKIKYPKRDMRRMLGLFQPRIDYSHWKST